MSHKKRKENNFLMKEVFIVDGIRTAIGKFAGALKDTRPDDMAALLIREIVKRNFDKAIFLPKKSKM